MTQPSGHNHALLAGDNFNFREPSLQRLSFFYLEILKELPFRAGWRKWHENLSADGRIGTLTSSRSPGESSEKAAVCVILRDTESG